MMASRTVVVAGLVALHALASSQRLSAQLSVKLEVTQGIQYLDHAKEGSNSIALVADRRTAVRAMVDGLGSGDKVTKISTEIHIDGTKAEIEPDNASGFQEFLNSGTTRDRTNTDHTLNFRIESLSDAKNNQVIKVGVTLDLMTGGPKTGAGSASVKVTKVHPLEIRLVPIKFVTRSGSVFGPPDREELETPLLELVESCFPIRVPDTVFTWQPSMTVEEDKDGCASIIDDREGKSDVDRVLIDLNSKYNYDDEKNVLVYGIVSPKPGGIAPIGDEYCWSTLGWALCNKRAAFGTAVLEFSPKTFAHELGHLLGLDHCGACGDMAEGCDMDGQVPFDVQTMTVPPDRNTSFMTCGGDEAAQVWATPNNYKKLLQSLEGDSTSITICSKPKKIKEPKERKKPQKKDG